MWAVLQGIPATTAFGLFLLMVLGLWLYTFTITGSLPHLPHVKAFIVNVSGSAVGNLLPAGGAAGAAATYQQLRSWGFGRRAISTSLIVTGQAFTSSAAGCSGPCASCRSCATPSPAWASTSSTSGTRPSRWCATDGCR